MTQFMHHQLLSSAIEVVANNVLSLDSGSQKSLTKLNGYALAIVLSEFERPFCCHICDNKLLITTPEIDQLSADCIITSSISTLVALKSEQQLTELIKQDKLDIDGDIKVAQQFASLLESLDIDWASELEKHIGDIATHKVITLARGLNKKLAFVASQVQADASEYLTYEKALVVTNTELSQHHLQIAAVTKQVSDVEHKLAQIAQRISAIQSNNHHQQ